MFASVNKTGTTAMELKLVALDEDDLGIVSTHLQDAVVKVADIHWRPAEKRLVMLLNRFDWEEASALAFPAPAHGAAVRARPRLPVPARQAARQGRRAQSAGGRVRARRAPAGHLTLTFSGGCALRLDVECIEVELADLGPAWDTTLRPIHPDDLQVDNR